MGKDYYQTIKLTEENGDKLRKIAYIKHQTIQKVLTKVVTDYINNNLELVKKHDEFFSETED